MAPCGSAPQAALHCASSANDQANEARHDGVFASSRDLSACRLESMRILDCELTPPSRTCFNTSSTASITGPARAPTHRFHFKQKGSGHQLSCISMLQPALDRRPCNLTNIDPNDHSSSTAPAASPDTTVTFRETTKMLHKEDNRGRETPARRRDEHLDEASRRPQHSSGTPGIHEHNLPGHQATASPPQRQVYQEHKSDELRSSSRFVFMDHGSGSHTPASTFENT